MPTNNPHGNVVTVKCVELKPVFLHNLRISDADLAGKPILLFEYTNDDDEHPASIGFIETDDRTCEAN